MFVPSIATTGLIASALFSQVALASTPPKGEYLGTAPVDLAGEIEIPSAELGVVVTYLEDGSVYAYQTGVGARAVSPRGCWGVQIGACCIGIYCSASTPGQASKRVVGGGGAQHDTIRVSGDGSGKVTSLTVYPDRSMDMSVRKEDDHGNHVEYTCIGVNVNGCCIGVCVL